MRLQIRHSSMRHNAKIALGLGSAALAVAAAVAGAIKARRPDLNERTDDAPDRAHKGTDSTGPHGATGKRLLIGEQADKLYSFWQEPRRLAEFMENVDRIEERDDGTAVWSLKSASGSPLKMITRVTEDKVNERISWQSTDASDVQAVGHVAFEDAPGNRGTYVELVTSHDAPPGPVAGMVSAIFGSEPAMQTRRDLKRFKMLIETGEIANSARTRAHSDKE